MRSPDLERQVSTREDEMEEKQMAIMKDVGFGNRDVGHPVLFFTAYVSEGVGALEILNGEDAMNFIKAYGVYDVRDLTGRPVWVEREGYSVKVVGPCIV